MAGSPHDTLVKKTFSIAANAEGEFRAILPAQVIALIDWSTLELEPGSFVDPDARAKHTDLLFSAQFAGRRALLYLLLEHQSRVERWMPKRMLTYIDRIWTAEQERGAKRLPIVLPMVLHHSKRGWTAGRHMNDLLDVSPDVLDIVRRYVPGFELLIDDLGRVPEAELLRRPMTAMARVTLWALRAQRVGHDPELIASWAPELERARQGAGEEALKVFFVYLTSVRRGGELLEAILSSPVDQNVREVVMGIRKQWEDEAEARGRAEGEARGRTEGEARGRSEGEARGRAEALLKLLQLRFVELPVGTAERVRGASIEQLDGWIERLLHTERLEDLWR